MFLHACALMRYVFACMCSYEICFCMHVLLGDIFGNVFLGDMFLHAWALMRYVFACMCSYEICFCMHVLL